MVTLNPWKELLTPIEGVVARASMRIFGEAESLSPPLGMEPCTKWDRKTVLSPTLYTNFLLIQIQHINQNPLHVSSTFGSSSGGPVVNCTHAASGIVTLYRCLSCATVRKELFSDFWPVFFCICRLSFWSSCCGTLLFFAIVCIVFHSLCFLSGSIGRECILVMWYL